MAQNGDGGSLGLPGTPTADSILGALGTPGGTGSQVPYGTAPFFQTGAYEGVRKQGQIMAEKREAALRAYALTEVAKEYEKTEAARKKERDLRGLAVESAEKDLRHKERTRSQREGADIVEAGAAEQQAMDAASTARLQSAARLAAPLTTLAKDTDKETANKVYSSVRSAMRASGINPAEFGLGDMVWTPETSKNAQVLNTQAVSTVEHMQNIDLKLLEARNAIEVEMLKNQGTPLESLTGEPLMMEYLRRSDPTLYRAYLDNKIFRLPVPGQKQWADLEKDMSNNVMTVVLEHLANSQDTDELAFVRDYTEASADPASVSKSKQRLEDIVRNISTSLIPVYTNEIRVKGSTPEAAWAYTRGQLDAALRSGAVKIVVKPDSVKGAGNWGATERMPLLETPASRQSIDESKIIDFSER